MRVSQVMLSMVASTIVAASVHGCAGTPIISVAATPARQGADETTLQVDNQAWSDIVVYVAEGGRPLRLGSVASHSSTTLKLPPHIRNVGGTLQLLARPIAGRAYLLPPVAISAGQRVAVTLMNQLPLSTIAVWDR